ncbi:MAG: energy transducer TonB [Bacteroidales bacterium]|jgi:TonB family protein|nr:energy transducer TonB [Bacteroidales bacterium]
MVRLFIFIFALFETSIVVWAQNRCDDTNAIDIFGEPEKFPVFNKKLSNTEGISKFFIDNIKYPQTAIEDKIEGKIYIQFWIDTIGITCEHKIIKGIREDIDNEALRVAKLIKFDEPAKNRGKPIGMCYGFPILFNLPDKNIAPRKW